MYQTLPYGLLSITVYFSIEYSEGILFLACELTINFTDVSSLELLDLVRALIFHMCISGRKSFSNIQKIFTKIYDLDDDL